MDRLAGAVGVPRFNIFKISILVLLAWPLNLVSAQAIHNDNNISFTRYTTEQGLSSNAVRKIAQDEKGFIWFGTWDGLNRFDGYDFKIYRPDKDNQYSISHSTVSDIRVGEDGIIWVATLGGGLNRFDSNSERFYHFRHDPDNPETISSDNIRSLYLDKSGILWIGTFGKGLSQFNPRTGVFINYQSNPDEPGSISGNMVIDIEEDSSGRLWVSTHDNGINYFDRETKKFVHFKPEIETDVDLSGYSGHSLIHEDRTGLIWFATASGLYSFRHSSAEFKSYGGNHFGVSQDVIPIGILEDSEAILWIITLKNGLFRYDRTVNRFINFRHVASDSSTISSNNIASIFQDRTKNIWIGTEDGGVNRFNLFLKQFNYYKPNVFDANSLDHPRISAIYEDINNNLWLGNYKPSLNKFNRKTGQFTHYENDPADPNSLPAGVFVSAILEDAAGILWIGVVEGGLSRFDPETETFKHYRHEPDNPQSLSNNKVLAIKEDRNGILWVGTGDGGLNRFDPKSETFKHFLRDPENPSSIKNNVRTIFLDRVGFLWLGNWSGSGLARFNPRKEEFKTYVHQAGDPNSLAGDVVRSIYQDDNGFLWLATSGGLNKFDPINEVFTVFTESNGLASKLVQSILPDVQGNLWLSTPKGISMLDLQTEAVTNYDSFNGLQDREFEEASGHAGWSGELFFGGRNGFNSFFPQRVKKNNFLPPVVITDFKLFNQSVPIGQNSVLSKAIENTEQLELSYQDTIFSFEFSALSYVAPEKNRYRYKLEGFETLWNEVDSGQRFASYTNLDPGKYVFRVLASNNDDVWNQKGQSIHIVIHPPFWQTLWFRILTGFSFGMLIYGVYRWRVNSLKQSQQILEEQVRLRTNELAKAKDEAETANRTKSSFLANMSHELRTPLNAILGFSELSERTPGLPGDVGDYLGTIHRSGEHLLELINDVLDMAKIEAGQTEFEPNAFDLLLTIHTIEDMFNLRTQTKGIWLKVEVAEDVPRSIKTDERKLRQVLINLLSNAVKFTSDGGVSLLVECVRDPKLQLCFEVEDTGPGIKASDMDLLFKPFGQTESGRRAREGTGLGLTISEEFVELMGGQIQVQSEVGKGTRFWFEIDIEEVDSDEVVSYSSNRRVIGLAEGQPAYRILVVDDSDDGRKLLVNLMADIGFNVRGASDGKEAVAIWNEWSPNLIWMDMQMPVLDGYGATEMIKETTKGQDTLVIALTASAFEEERSMVMGAGCDDFLRKPFRAEELFEAMTKHLKVQFEYETTVVPDSFEIKKITQEDLSGLSSAQIKNLHDAALRGDVYRLEHLSQEVALTSPELAKQLDLMISQFEFEPIIEVTKQSKHKSREDK
ncbi:hybrid sensor histidine kinase/response regulator [Aliikangiella coralliicola]|nr:hybrid sensor histidine kinase/response regulator [Aliikangiella coralliicola]